MRREGGIVVTGLGVLSPLGLDTDDFWSALLDGAVGTREITRFDTSALSCHRGGELRHLRAADAPEVGESLAARLAVRAASAAVEDASLALGDVQPKRFGAVFGSVMATRPAVEAWLSREPRCPGANDRVEGEWQWAAPSRLARAPAEALGLGGPNCLLASACASGNSAIAYAAELLHAVRADAMVAGAADEISYAMLLMFESFRALAPDVVQPFDRDRRGLMLAEGAAVLVLEREADARARGARMYGRVLGYSNVCDAHHITAPHPQGRGAARSMLATLRHAGAAPCDVDYICAHGTGTPSNDAVESCAIRTVFGAYADHLPVSSLKGAIGHAQGAASAIEAASCLLSLRDGVVPATANYTTPDPACDLDVVAGRPRKAALRMVLSNAFGFGGNIECVAFGTV